MLDIHMVRNFRFETVLWPKALFLESLMYVGHCFNNQLISSYKVMNIN